MSIFYYIGAQKELDLGTFGLVELERTCGINETPKIIEFKNSSEVSSELSLTQMVALGKFDNCKVIYETTVDAAGISISLLHSGYDEISKRFKNDYVYSLSPEWGSFGYDNNLKKICEQTYLENRKCLNVLLEYIKNRIEGDEFIEVYGCWADEESQERNQSLDVDIDLTKFVFKSFFNIDDKKYIRFSKS